MVVGYWKRVAARSWRRSLELARLESAERIVVFLVGLLVPAIAAWFVVGPDTATTVRVLASLGASFIAIALMFGWSLLKLPALMEAEAVAERQQLAAQLETHERRKATREQLGKFLARGTDLRARTRTAASEDAPPPEAEANEWYGELCGYLACELGDSYVARIMDGAAAPIQMSSLDGMYRELDGGIRIRLFHLEQFMRELS